MSTLLDFLEIKDTVEEEHKEILNEEQLEAFKAIVCKFKNVFLTGGGGTGKSFLVRYIANYIKKKTKRKIQITALTGIASINFDYGRTVHSWAGIGLGDKPAIELALNINQKPFLKRNWVNTDILVIDEISMMTGELFDKLNTIAKVVRKNDKPFGGIQLVLVGDFCQLPPVKSTDFCFLSNSWKECVSGIYQLNILQRQISDPKYGKLLKKLRRGILSKKSRE